MTTTTDLLTLTQWLSPAFPLGSYAYSHGLETAITDGDIHDGDSLRDWVSVVLSQGSGWNDAMILRMALDGSDMRATARALSACAERREESEAQGASFVQTLAGLGQQIEPGPLPAVVGQAARGLDVPSSQVIALYLHGMVGNLISCAVRFVPLGQTDGQRVLGQLHPQIDRVAQDVIRSAPATWRGGAVRSDIAAMRHEHQSARQFAS